MGESNSGPVMVTPILSSNGVSVKPGVVQFQRVPEDLDLEPHIDYVYRVAKYVAKTFDLFDRETDVSVDTPSSFDSFVSALRHLIGGPLVLQTTLKESDLKASKDVFVLRKDEFAICYAGIKRNSTSGNSGLASTRWYGARMACMRPACRWTLGRNSSDCWMPSISPAR